MDRSENISVSTELWQVMDRHGTEQKAIKQVVFEIGKIAAWIWLIKKKWVIKTWKHKSSLPLQT